MSVLVTTRTNRLPDESLEDTAGHPLGPTFPASSGKLMRPPVASAAPEQRILVVEFRSPGGRSWHAIGGGAMVPAAIDWARGSCSDDETWHLVSGMTWMATSVEAGPAPRRGSPISGTR